MKDLNLKMRGFVYNPNTGKYEKGKHGPARKVQLSREELAALRKQMSVNVMAEDLGVSRGTVYKYLRTADLINKGDEHNVQQQEIKEATNG